MRVIGLEPTRLAAPDPKSGMSTNFTIPAKIVSANIRIIITRAKIIFIILRTGEAIMNYEFFKKILSIFGITNFQLKWTI